MRRYMAGQAIHMPSGTGFQFGHSLGDARRMIWSTLQDKLQILSTTFEPLTQECLVC